MPDINLPIPGEDPNWAPKLNNAVLTVSNAVDDLPNSLKPDFLGLVMAPISPVFYGASSDGSASDDSAAVQAAINAAQDRGYRGGPVSLLNHRLASPVRISSTNITLEGQGGTIKGRGLELARSTTASDIFARVQDLTIDLETKTTGRPGILLDRVGRVQLSNMRIMNCDVGISVPARDETQHVRRVLMTMVEVSDCNYGWQSLQLSGDTNRFTVGDVQLMNSQWYNNKVTFMAQGIDGLIVNAFKSFQRQNANRERAFDLDYINFANFAAVNLFEPGYEALRLSRAQNFHWSGGNIAWPGQRAMRSGILLENGDLGGNGFADSSFDGIGIIKPTKHGIEVVSPVDRVEIGHTVRVEQAGSSEFYSGTDDLGSITHYGVITPSDATQMSVFAVATANRHLLRHGGVSAALNGEGKIQRTPRTLTIDDTRTSIDGTKGYEEVLCAAPTTHTLTNLSAGESGQEILFTGIIGGRTTIAANSTSGASNKVYLKDGASSVTIPLNGAIRFRYRNSTWMEQTRSWT